MRRFEPRVSRVAAILVLGLAATGLGLPALADPNDSDPAVQEARRQEQLAAASVQQIEGMLEDLQTETAAAEVVAGRAAEAYNQAKEDLDLATAQADQARQAAEQASVDLTKARGRLARVAITTSQTQTGLNELRPFLTENGFEDVFKDSSVLSLVGSTTERASARLAVAEQAAEAATVRADQAEGIRQTKADAEQTKAEAAQQAVEAAQAAQQAAEEEHTRLLAVLAEKKNSTIAAEQAAEQRRIEEANRRAEEERLRREQEALRPPPPSQTDTGQVPEDSSEAAAPGTVPANSGTGSEAGSNSVQGWSGAISSDDAAAAALEWARQQIGKPYQWGGTGPNSFDCSGLVQAAYRNGAGKAIPRVAASQYGAATKVAYSEMRPGDLIFWGSDLHHVAMFSGNGMMVEAPSSGLDIREIPIRWAGTVAWAGRY